MSDALTAEQLKDFNDNGSSTKRTYTIRVPLKVRQHPVARHRADY